MSSSDCIMRKMCNYRKLKKARKDHTSGEKATGEGTDIQLKTFYNVSDIILNQLNDILEHVHNTTSLYKYLSKKALNDVPLLDLKKTAADLCKVYERFVLTCKMSQKIKKLKRQLFKKKLKALHHLQILQRIVKRNIFKSYSNITNFLWVLILHRVRSEKNFSKLKRIKNYFRSSMNHIKFRSLSLLAIKYDVFTKVHFDEVIDNFANPKGRKFKII